MWSRTVRAPSRLITSTSTASLISATESLPLVEHPITTWRRDLLDDLWRRLEIVTVCVAYAIFGPAVIVVNNHIVKDLNFPYPMILSAIGLFTTACFCTILMHTFPSIATRADAAPVPVRLDRSGIISPDVAATGPDSGDSSPVIAVRAHSPVTERWRPTWSFWLHNMAPIGVMQGITFACGNAAYMHLTITFTQMLSASTPTVTLVFLYLWGVETPTLRSTFLVLLIGVGCAIASYGEGHFHPIGVAFRTVGIVTEAIRLVLTQVLLQRHRLNIVESQYYLAPIGALSLLAAASVGEWSRARTAGAWQIVWQHPLAFGASAILGLAASFMTFLVIKVTNSVTLKVLNTARNAGFVLFTVTFLGETASTLQLIGYSISLTAFSIYTYYKLTDQRRKTSSW